MTETVIYISISVCMLFYIFYSIGEFVGYARGFKKAGEMLDEAMKDFRK